MPNEAEHTQLALHNIQVIDYLLDEPKFCDWAAIAIFYTALHIVEAVFFYDKRHSGMRHGYNHETRECILKGTKSYHNIWEHYRPLQSASVKARYLEGLSKKGLTFQQHMPSKQVEERLIKRHLAQLIKTASRFLSSNSGDLLKEAFNKTFK